MRKHSNKGTQVRTVHFGTTAITYELMRDPATQLKITVHPDLRVQVIAPQERTVEEIDLRVLRRAPWIIKQLSYFHQFLPIQPKRRYVSGESHYYLGRQYRLKVIESKEEKSVKLKGRYITVLTPLKNDTQVIQKQLEGWYRFRAGEIFFVHMEKCHEKLKKHGISFPRLQIRRLQKRWGSLSPSGIMLLNVELIKAPLQCIDYVIMHELCHTKEPHHGPKFESLLTKCMPNWQLVKERLERSVMAR